MVFIRLGENRHVVISEEQIDSVVNLQKKKLCHKLTISDVDVHILHVTPVTMSQAKVEPWGLTPSGICLFFDAIQHSGEFIWLCFDDK